MMMPNRLPSEITPEILTFCRQIDPSRAPLWVPVRPSTGAGGAHDFAALNTHVTRQGGRIQFGWILWEHPGWYLEAEFHPLWSSAQAELVEATPGPATAQLSRILFLPDASRTFQGEDVPNRFQALSRSPDVVSVVQHAEFLAKLQAETRTQNRKARSQAGNPGRNDPCPCGSGLKYKKCCGAGAR